MIIVNDKIERRHKRGDVREDGKIFWQRYRDKEMWVTPEKYKEKHQKGYFQCKKYQAKNLEKINAARREKRKTNGDYIRERERKWWASNPEKAKALVRKKHANQGQEKRRIIMRPIWAKRRAKIKNLLPNLTENQKKIIKCFYNQAERLFKRFGIKFHVDHIVPIAKGGLHAPTNLQVLPASLNFRKNCWQIYRWSELQLN
jgi:hypothetical protein